MNLKLFLESLSFDIGNKKVEIPVSEILINLDDVRTKALEVGDELFKCDSIYEVEIFPKIQLYKALYEDIDYSLLTHEEKKALTLLIDRTPTITDNLYNTISNEISSLSTQESVAFICFYSTRSSVLHIQNNVELLVCRRYYLARIRDESEFLCRAPLCFPNIYFHPQILQAIKGLSAPLDEYADEIIYHLSALNDQFIDIFETYRNENLDKVLSVFSAQAQLAASLEGDAKGARSRLSFSFSGNDGKEIKLVCEPHTKLEKSGAKGDSRYRFDRIYFHPGKDNVEGGKILVAHIGKHL